MSVRTTCSRKSLLLKVALLVSSSIHCILRPYLIQNVVQEPGVISIVLGAGCYKYSKFRWPAEGCYYLWCNLFSSCGRVLPVKLYFIVSLLFMFAKVTFILLTMLLPSSSVTIYYCPTSLLTVLTRSRQFRFNFMEFVRSSILLHFLLFISLVFSTRTNEGMAVVSPSEQNKRLVINTLIKTNFITIISPFNFPNMTSFRKMKWFC